MCLRSAVDVFIRYVHPDPFIPTFLPCAGSGAARIGPTPFPGRDQKRHTKPGITC